MKWLILISSLTLSCTSWAALTNESPAGTSVTPAYAPAATAPAWANDLRVSAIIQFEGGLKVGFVNAASHESFFVGVGEKRQGYALLEANFDKEYVLVRHDGESWRMQLEKDPNAKPMPLADLTAGEILDDNIYRGEGIEAFLREHPNAVIKGNFPALQPPPEGTPPVTGFGPGIEKFLSENPELAKKARQPASGRGETIERFLANNPDVADQVNRPVEGKGEGIEKFLRENPALAAPATPGIPFDETRPAPPASP